MKQESWEGIQEMYEKGEISAEQYDAFVAIKNLSEEEYEQIGRDYIEGKISKEEYDQIKEIREMPDDWKTLENGIKGISLSLVTGAWEGLQWYTGNQLNQMAFGGGNVLDSALRVEADTIFNAMDTPFRTIIDSIATGNTLGESFEEQGGWNSVLTNFGIGLIGSIGGEAFDGVVTKIQTTNNIKLAKNLMMEYFNNNPSLGITKEHINKSFAKVIVCKNDKKFSDIAHKLTTWSDYQIDNTRGFRSSYNGGVVVLRADTSVVTVIHEINHDLGNVYIQFGDAYKRAENRGLDEALTERLALKIAKEGGFGESGYAVNVGYLNKIVMLLENAGYKDIDAMSYYGWDSELFANTMCKIFGNDDFYVELVKNMNIADMWGGVTDLNLIRQANINIEALIDTLEKKLGG